MIEKLETIEYCQNMSAFYAEKARNLREEYTAHQRLASIRVVEPTEDEIAYARKLKKEGWE